MSGVDQPFGDDWESFRGARDRFFAGLDADPSGDPHSAVGVRRPARRPLPAPEIDVEPRRGGTEGASE